MTVYRIIVPLEKDGSPEVAHHVANELVKRFGGVTEFMGMGLWKPGDLDVMDDRIVVFEAARFDSDPIKASGDWAFMQGIARHVKAQLSEEAVYISHRPEGAELV
jgi:hypothetical protein